MSKSRNNVHEKHTVVSQTIIRDPNLSMAERGMLVTLLSLPNGWEFSVAGLCEILPDGQTVITDALKKLEEHGYLKCNKLKDAQGRFYDVEWVICEKP